MTYTIITGASMGIGKALAIECARRGQNLILVSLPEEELPEIARRLAERWNVDVRHRETDLTEEGSVDRFYRWCRDQSFRIDMLINNAGLGSQGPFEHSTPEIFRPMIRLNMETVVSMCWGALPFLKREEKSYIMNLGSIGAYNPAPYKAVYTSSKHFVRFFSATLHYELKDSPVFVACLCPGPTLTNDIHRAKVKELGLTGKILSRDAAEVAKYGLDQLFRGKRVIIPGLGNRILCWISERLPIALRLKLAASHFTDSDYNHTAGKPAERLS